MLHAFTFFNIGNRFEDRIWKLLKYDHCCVAREPREEGVYVCVNTYLYVLMEL